MSRLSNILRGGENGNVSWHCPGCDMRHSIRVGEGVGPRWGWNGDVDKPTFTPSVLVTGEDFTEKGEADLEAWRAAGYPELPAGFKFDSRCIVCHSFVVDGQMQFLSDCTHSLAGQTVPIPPLVPFFGEDSAS